MNVAELIAKLSELDPQLEVIVNAIDWVPHCAQCNDYCYRGEEKEPAVVDEVGIEPSRHYGVRAYLGYTH